MRRSVMSSSHNFAQVPKAEIQRSAFDRSHGYKTTFDAGYLIPVLIDEALPGDTFSWKPHFFARLNTPLVPFMDNVFLDYFAFAVPYRLVWDNFQKFMGEQTDPGDSTDYLIPVMANPTGSGGVANGSLSDYFGIPTESTAVFDFVSLWHRAYNLIWNEWFRDQNIQDSVVVDRDDGPDTYTDYVLLRRGKRHDYFTSCLPWPQKGPDVSLPLGIDAPVYSNPVTGSYASPGTYNLWQGRDATPSSAARRAAVNGGSANEFQLIGTGINLGGLSLGSPADYAADANSSPPYADLTQATAATINDLREAFQLQRFYERDARGGTRYTEIIRSHFGVISPDARLQRPEYLGGGSVPVNVTPIAQTSSTDGTSPQGNLAAMGTVASSGGGFTKSFQEHTLIICLVSVRADLNYQQGLHRKFSRRSREEMYWPVFAHLGEQAVLNQEIDVYNGSLTGVFGYQERYAEYRYFPSIVTGQFRSNYAQTLDMWHLAQEFSALPVLTDPTFIVENPPIDRVIATPSEPHFKLDCYHKLKCARPMPTFSVPGLIDHF